MNSLNNRRTAILLTLAIAATATLTTSNASARTVALWPLGNNRDDVSTLDVGNAMRPWYFGFSAASDVSVEDSTPDGWNLPPNPVAASELRHGAATRHCIVADNDGGINSGAITVSEQELADYLYPTNDFTIEGWMRLDAFDMTKANWRIIINAGNGSGSTLGWMLSLRTNGNADNAYLNFYSQNMNKTPYPNTGDKKFYNFVDGKNAARISDLYGIWHHYAVVFDHTNPDNQSQSRFRLYFDNRLVGTVTQTKMDPAEVTAGSNRLDIGGRPDTTGQHIKGAFSYWRVCDEALEPAQFLTANGAKEGTTVAADPAPESVTGLSLVWSNDDTKSWCNTGVQVRDDATSNCTFEAWIYPRANGTGIMSQFSDDEYRSQWTVLADKLRFSMYDPTASAWIRFDSKRNVPLNKWTHVAFVMDKDVWRFYINGEEDSIRTDCGHLHLIGKEKDCDGVVLGSQRLWHNPYDPNLGANIDIAEARVWKRARTAEEIYAHYGARIAKPEDETDLIGYWPLNEGTVGESANGLIPINYAKIDVAGCAFRQREWLVSTAAYSSLRAFVTNGVWVSGTTDSLAITGALPAVSVALRNNAYNNGIDTGIDTSFERFTFTGWYFPAYSQESVENCIISKSSSGNGRFHLRQYGSRFHFWIGGGDNGKTNEEFSAYADFPIGKWSHVALVRDGTKSTEIYVNGELAGKSEILTLPIHATAHFQIAGFNAGGSTGKFNGLIREFGLWRTVLTQEQIRETMTSRPQGTESRLVGYWPLDDGEGTQARNLKAGGASATAISPNGTFNWETLYEVPRYSGTLDFPVPGMMFMLR